MMGGLSLVMLQLGKTQSKLQRTASQSSELAEFNYRVSRFIAKSDVCSKNLEGLSLAVNPDDEDDSKRVSVAEFYNTDYDGSQRVLFKTKASDPKGRFQPSPKLEIEDIYFSRTGPETTEIKFVINKKETAGKRSSFGANQIIKTFKVTTIYDDSDKVLSCYSDYESGAAAACSSIGGELMPDGQCMNSKLCDMEKKTLANTYEGGTTTLCDPEEEIEGIGLHNMEHSKYQCTGMGGTVVTISDKKLCEFSGKAVGDGGPNDGCAEGWTREYTKTSPTTSTGIKGNNCARPKCTTGSHSTWGGAVETCTHAEKREKKNFLDDCDNYGSVTAYATITSAACY